MQIGSKSTHGPSTYPSRAQSYLEKTPTVSVQVCTYMQHTRMIQAFVAAYSEIASYKYPVSGQPASVEGVSLHIAFA